VREALFWIVAAVVVGGQLLLVRSAWRLRRPAVDLPPGVPRSDARSDLAWTVLTALLTFVLLYFAYLALP
jgi:heme/copper-type cytochrome/quinol oxidase subunit 2